MWPKILDLDTETCLGILRRLELEAYSSVVKALRAQGDLSKERRKILQDLGNVLSIPLDRHKSEIRRAANDELLGTLALKVGGSKQDYEWAREGRRIIPLLRRAGPISSLRAKADKACKEILKAGFVPPEETRSKGPPPALRHSRNPPPPSLESLLQNGNLKPDLSIPERPPGGDEEDDVIVLPSGMAVRFKKEGKGGLITTIVNPSSFSPPLPPPPAPAESKKTTKKTKRKQTDNNNAIFNNKKSKTSPKTNAVSQAGHGYARPFVVNTPSKRFQTPSTVQTSPSTTTFSNPTLNTPQKVVLVTDPSKVSPLKVETATTISSSSIKLPSTSTRLPSSVSKDTLAKVIQAPPGTRILPKPGGGSVAVPGSQPIYVVAAPAGTNVVTTLPSSTSTRIVGGTNNNNTRPPTVSRVVAVGSPRGPPSSSIPPGAAPPPPPVLTGIQTTPTTIRTIQGAAIKAFQPRPNTTTIRHHSGKPSVIVVQRKAPPASSVQTVNKTNALTKDIINKQPRIYHASKGNGKPLVIVSKPQSIPSVTASPSLSTTTSTTTSNQGNVIVLDLSQEQVPKNSVLSDILQATGILTEESESKEPKAISVKPVPTLTEIVVQRPAKCEAISIESSKISPKKSKDPVSEKDNNLAKKDSKLLIATAITATTSASNRMTEPLSNNIEVLKTSLSSSAISTEIIKVDEKSLLKSIKGVNSCLKEPDSSNQTSAKNPTDN